MMAGICYENFFDRDGHIQVIQAMTSLFIKGKPIGGLPKSLFRVGG